MTVAVEEANYPHLVLRGTPYERGFEHGRSLKNKISQLGQHYKESDTLPPWDWCENVIVNCYLPALAQYDPYAMEEIRGISEGSETELTVIMLINARYDLTKYKNNDQFSKSLDTTADECTTGTLIDEGSVKMIQNWDLDDYIYKYDLCVILETHTSPQENLPKCILTLGEVGQLGRSGMNSKGLGLCANALNSNMDFFAFPQDFNDKNEVEQVKEKYGIKLPVIPISFARRKFLSCHSFANGLKYIVQAPRHVSGNVMVATREAVAMDFELTDTSYQIVHPTYVDSKTGAEILPCSDARAILTHSNHFLLPRYSCSGQYIHCKNPGGSSFYRHNIMTKRFVDIIKGTPVKDGIPMDSIREAISDTTCAPNSLSEEENPRCETAFDEPEEILMTVATAIYDLNKGTAIFCKGPPHLSKQWKKIQITME